MIIFTKILITLGLVSLHSQEQSAQRVIVSNIGLVSKNSGTQLAMNNKYAMVCIVLL